VNGSVKSILRDGEPDLVAVEEPLEIRAGGEAIAVTMRTLGATLTWRRASCMARVCSARRPTGLTDDFAANTIEVHSPLARQPASRRFYTTSSCGLCGKGALEEVAVHAEPLPPGPSCARELLAGLPDRLVQPAFARSGGIHATGCSNGTACSSMWRRTSAATTRWTR
jgi:FdhD protein